MADPSAFYHIGIHIPILGQTRHFYSLLKWAGYVFSRERVHKDNACD